MSQMNTPSEGEGGPGLGAYFPIDTIDGDGTHALPQSGNDKCPFVAQFTFLTKSLSSLLFNASHKRCCTFWWLEDDGASWTGTLIMG